MDGFNQKGELAAAPVEWCKRTSAMQFRQNSVGARIDLNWNFRKQITAKRSTPNAKGEREASLVIWWPPHKFSPRKKGDGLLLFFSSRELKPASGCSISLLQTFPLLSIGVYGGF